MDLKELEKRWFKKEYENILSEFKKRLDSIENKIFIGESNNE